MTTLHERIETALPLQDAFDFIADFANAAHGIRASPRPSGSTAARSATAPGFDGGPDGRPVAPMQYVVTTGRDPFGSC